MPPKPPSPPDSTARPLAPHVARAIQAKPAATPPSGRRLAPHVAKAIQAKAAPSSRAAAPHRPMAPHVNRAIQACSAPGAVQPASGKKGRNTLKEELASKPQVRFPGMPPSQFPKLTQPEKEGKYASKSDYIHQRAGHQTEDRRVHIGEHDLEALLREVEGRGADVMASMAYVNGEAVPVEVTDSWQKELATPFEHDHEGEYAVSSGDVEVGFLSGALDLFVADLKTNGYDGEPRVHELVLADNFGACDGCKDRIKRFKLLWHETATQLYCTAKAQLKVTYVYHERHKATRDKIESLYGWEEASSMTLGTGKDKLKYWSWSAKPKEFVPKTY